MSRGPFGLDSLREDVGNKVDKEEGKGLSTNDLTNSLLEEFGKVENKVDKEEGKGLSTHDYDDTAKESVDNMGTAASRNVMTSSTDMETPNALMPRGAFGIGEFAYLKNLGGANVTTWTLLAKLRGGSESSGAAISFDVLGGTSIASLTRSRFSVLATQRGNNRINVQVYKLGTPDAKIGYVQVGTYDFDIYIERIAWAYMTVTGGNGFGSELVKDLVNSTEEPAGITYVTPNAVLHTGNTGTAASRDVTTSQTDTTAGRLLKVGDFGVGATTLGSAADFAQGSGSGLYRAFGAGSPTSTPNAPPLSGNNILGVVELGVTSNIRHYLATENQGVASPKLWIGTSGQSSPPSWVFGYHTGNTVGPVSQSNGVPTGAIIQRGSNANGQFVRYADGTQICTFRAAQNIGSPIKIGELFLGDAITRTYAASFVEVSSVNIQTSRGQATENYAYGGIALLREGQLNPINASLLSSVTFRVASLATWNSLDCAYSITVIGRWF